MIQETRQYERDRRKRVHKFTPEQLTPNEQQPWRCAACNEPVGPAKRHCACTRPKGAKVTVTPRPARTRIDKVFTDKILPTTYLTSHEAGRLIQVNPSSINKWIKEGRIASYRTPGGHRRIQAAAFVAFLTQYEMPVPDALADVQPAVAAPPPRAAAKKRARAK